MQSDHNKIQSARLRVCRWLTTLIVSSSLLVACGGGGGGSGPGTDTTGTNKAPTNVRLVEVSSSAVGAVSASWLPATDDTTATAAIKYQVHASTDSTFTPSIALLGNTLKFEGTGVTSANITSGLDAGRTYFVRLVAIDKDGSATTGDALPINVSDSAATPVTGAVVTNMAASQVALVTANTVVLQTGVATPLVDQFISSAEANGGQGYLRKVTAVTSQNGITTLQTRAASLNEVFTNLQLSSTVKMTAVPKVVASASVQSGLAVMGATVGDQSNHSFSWPDSGLRYSAGVRQTPQQATAQPRQVGLTSAAASFSAGNYVSTTGSYGKAAGNNRITIAEGATGSDKLILSVINDSIPWFGSAVGVCKVTVGASSKPSGVSISLGSLATVQSVAADNRIKVANQILNFSAATGTASDAPYKIKATAFFDDIGDGCNGNDFTGVGWRDYVDFEFEILVTSDTFPVEEPVEKVFGGSAGFTVKNKIVTSFDPLLIVQQRLNDKANPYARIEVQASPKLIQTLAIKATAQGAMDAPIEIIAPRKFYKVYVAGGVPIVISGTFKMDMRIKGDVSGALDATEQLTIGYDNISFGMEYVNGAFAPIKSVTPVYNLKVGGNGKAEANLTISLLPSFELTAYEVLTGKVVLEPYLNSATALEGFVALETEVDFDAQQVNMAADADYRITKTSLGGGVNAWLYADLHVFDYTIKAWPADANGAKYDTFHKVELIANTPIMDIPALNAFVPTGTASGTAHPADSRAIKVRAVATNLPNPLRTLFPSLRDSYIKWVRWTAPRIIAPLGTPADSYKLLADPNGEEGVAWVVLTKPGSYTVRMGGHSEWGTWARQYTELQIDVADANANGIPDWWEQRYGLTGTGSAIANADPDGDGKTNLQEWQAGTNPLVSNGPPPFGVPTQTVVIDTAVDDFGPQTGLVAHNGSTDDTTPALSGTITAPLTVGQKVIVYDGTTAYTVAAVVAPGGTTWTFTPAMPLATGAHSFSAEVTNFESKPGPRSVAYVVNVQPAIVVPVTSVSAVSPTQIVRTLTGSFDIVGQNLPTSAISITVPGDAKATCQAPNNLTASGFNVACQFYKLGAQTLEIRTATTLLGTVTVTVKTNVTGVSWTSPSTTSSGTVKFGETVAFKVAGVNMLADPTMGFAVQLCGVSNTETGTPSNTLRTFSCNFNNTAGAVAGQMPGVVKDAPGGQVLFDGWNVAVAVPVAPPIATATPSPSVVGQLVNFMVSTFQSAVKVVWDFGTDVASVAKAVISGVSDKVSATFTTPGTKTVTATFSDASNNVVAQSTTTVTVSAATIPGATITAAASDTSTKPGTIPNNGTTDDTTPTLSGTISAPLTNGQKVNVYDGTTVFTAMAVVPPGGTTWTFTPATPLIGGLHSFTAEVADFQGIPGARSAAYVVNVLSTSVASVSPGAITRTLPGSFDIVGRDLPTSGISVTVPGDAKAVCQAPNNLTASGFKVACQFNKLGAQTLEIRTATTLLGTVTVTVKTNVTGVTWTSPSTTSSGTVKFGETVAFKVAGVNMLADPTMGFAVQLCGVSNTEIGIPSNTLRTFSCNFNNTAGAVAGQMPGVVKDAPGGQVLFDGWNVAVEVPVDPPAATGRLPDTGITASQCYAAGSDALVSCTSAAAIALNSQQDGMRGRDVASNDNTDGKAGFSYTKIGANGETLPASATVWSCVKDNITGLMWEVKTADRGLRDMSKSYTNYDSTTSLQIGGTTAPTQAQIDAATNSVGFRNAVNTAGLCGATDWRLPTADDLQGIVDYGVAYPGSTIDATWFPNTHNLAFWSSSPFVGVEVAWGVSFSHGDVSFYFVRGSPLYVRLVRAVP